MTCNEEEVGVDVQTSAAIKLGIRAANEGHVVPSEQVRGLVTQWVSEFSTRGQP